MANAQQIADQLIALMEQFKTQHGEWTDGKKAAAGRARKAVGEIKKLVTAYRKASVEETKAQK